MKFGVIIIFRTGSCRIIQSCSPGGANSSRTGDSRWCACQHLKLWLICLHRIIRVS